MQQFQYYFLGLNLQDSTCKNKNVATHTFNLFCATGEERVAPFAAAPAVPKNMRKMSRVSAALQQRPAIPTSSSTTAGPAAHFEAIVDEKCRFDFNPRDFERT